MRDARDAAERYAIHQRWLRGEIDTPTHDAGRWSSAGTTIRFAVNEQVREDYESDSRESR
jgi:hypothetical protein